ncbi:heparinase II/III domain-containing protein [Salinimonas sediminis]|nr:heparinase II/III family protein [Salinimonas sediminis]
MKQPKTMLNAVINFFLLLMLCGVLSWQAKATVLIDNEDVKAMREAAGQSGRFAEAYQQLRKQMDKVIAQPTDVPVPVDAGGGYTHEQHKRNYQNMYQAGQLYLLSGDKKYADYVTKMLLDYAALYPTLPRHPQRKSSNEGKLFWQGLNEAVWLVHTIQAYDFIKDSLSEAQRQTIEKGALRPVATFLSVESPHTFNKVHNHGTWANAAVGMTGYVIGEPKWVEWALYDLNESGKGGFLKQLQQLFSPDGYYTEGPYYQRYALMPFVTFASAIEQNEPERKIFEYRNGILEKAIQTTIELSYNGLFFPLNDAIKSKGISTIELVHGVALAYQLTGDTRFLDIAKQQDTVLLTPAGLAVSQALDNNEATAYTMPSRVYLDGPDGKQGALAVLRAHTKDKPAVVFKATSQGMGHGHFDKLTWQFYDKGNEIVSDYGAVRFLNVVTKEGGRYLPENTSYGKQSIAHNTMVVDETSHFNGKVNVADRYAPTLLFDQHGDDLQIAAANIDTAYQDTMLQRVIALVTVAPGKTLAVDIISGNSPSEHQYDVPLHYQGQLTYINQAVNSYSKTMSALGDANGYQHLWLQGEAPFENQPAQVSWLNDNGKFYTLTTAPLQGKVMFTQIGAGDPNFNLRNEKAVIVRQRGQSARVVSVLEPHGSYDAAKEQTVASTPDVASVAYGENNGVSWVQITLKDDQQHMLAYRTAEAANKVSFAVNGQQYTLTKHAQLFKNIK